MQTPPATDAFMVDLEERPWAAYAACRQADPGCSFPLMTTTPNPPSRSARVAPSGRSACCGRSIPAFATAYGVQPRSGIAGGCSVAPRRPAVTVRVVVVAQ